MLIMPGSSKFFAGNFLRLVEYIMLLSFSRFCGSLVVRLGEFIYEGKHLNNKIDNSYATKEYVKLEQALIASEARFRVIFDKAAIGIIVVEIKQV